MEVLSTVAEIVANTVSRKQRVLFQHECAGRVAHTRVVHVLTLTRLSVLEKLQCHPVNVSVSSLQAGGRLARKHTLLAAATETFL